MRVLYNHTKKEEYLDILIDLLKNDARRVRHDALCCLALCGKSEKLYNVYRQQCIVEDDELNRLRCVDGMLYCKNLIRHPVYGLQTVEEPWKRLKVGMYTEDRSKEERYKALLEFEELVKNYK